MPSRILKDSICTSDNLNKLDAFQETFFYRLLVNCDDYGRFDARPEILKARLYPLKDIRMDQIAKALQALASAELVILYQVDGKPFVQMSTWERHQQIRAKKSKYPAPETRKQSPDIICNQMISNDIICHRNPIQSNPVVTRAREDNDGDLLQTAEELNSVFDAARGIGLSTSTDLDKANLLCADYTAPWVLEALRRTASAPPSARCWRYVEGILRSWRAAGGMDAETAKPKAQKPRKEKYTCIVNGEERTFEREVIN